MQKISNQKKIQIHHLLAISLSFFSLCLFSSSCYEPIEGCLDINSANYQVSADRSCDSCCVFPDFNININQVWNGEEFELGDTLINAQGNEVILNDYLIVMSGFSLIAENQGYTIIETVELTCLTSSVVPYFVPNDVVVITPNSTAISLGEFNSSDIYNQLDFLIGVNECFHNASLDELDNISTVSQIETLYTDGEGFTNMYFTFADSTRIDFAGVPDVIQLNKAVNASSSLGQDLAIDMTIDLGVWLEDIDLSESTLVSKSKIGLKVEQAISIE